MNSFIKSTKEFAQNPNVKCAYEYSCFFGGLSGMYGGYKYCVFKGKNRVFPEKCNFFIKDQLFQ
jgi:hypothetical protein